MLEILTTWMASGGCEVDIEEGGGGVHIQITYQTPPSSFSLLGGTSNVH